MSFIGKEYKLEKQENFDGFLDALGPDVPPEHKQKLLSDKPTFKVEKNGDTYKIFRSDSGEVSFKSGVEFDETVTGGRVAKSTVTVDGNTITHVQKFDNGVVFNFKREFNGDEAVATITNSFWDGVARRYYKAV